MRYLSLFSGVGGGDLGCQHLLGWKCVGYVEWEKYPCQVLEARIKDGMLSDAPIWNVDIREFNERTADQYRGVVDVVTGGFPCQPFSAAGKRKGADDERNMWPPTCDTIRRVGPEWCLLENVPGLASTGYLDTVIGDLHALGYDTRWDIVSAADCGAPHRRDRQWIVAHSRTIRCNAGRPEQPLQRAGPHGETQSVARRNATDEGHAPLSDADSERSHRAETDDARQGIEVQSGDEQIGVAGPMGEAVADAARDVAGREVERSERQRAWPGGESTWWDRDPADVGDTDGAAGRCERGASEEVPRSEEIERPGRPGGGLADSPCVESRQPSEQEGRKDTRGGGEEIDGADGQPESFVGRVATGVSNRVDRLKGLGNAQVPLVAAVAWDRLHRDLIR